MDHHTVENIMTEDVIAVKSSETLAEVYQVLDNHNFRHLPVVNKDYEIVGIISQRDILQACITDESMMVATIDRGQYLSDFPVADLMSTDPVTVDRETTIADACQLLLDQKFDSLPVVEGRKLVGILTATDFIKELLQREEAESTAV